MRHCALTLIVTPTLLTKYLLLFSLYFFFAENNARLGSMLHPHNQFSTVENVAISDPIYDKR